MYSPLKKREEIWGESHLAVACGIVTEDDVSSRLWLFFPSNGPTSFYTIRLAPSLFSIQNWWIPFEIRSFCYDQTQYLSIGLALIFEEAFILFVCTRRDSSGKVRVDLVIYSSAKPEDFTSYYNRLEKLLADESAMGNTLKPLQVSRKSVTETVSREKKISSYWNIVYTATC